ncbi:hypothetical protein KR093_001133 [Drosophila rubida]|uniref:Uncharacterized protein n=1 Tax=Drosophila rubida TaxID=30044 RepID=A0AAD4PM79_9MUSC|nr:hypothetical protein KR093_001133 [Drosophila rubida]
MCPNQEVERSLLPDCHIANRVFMYSMLDYLHSGERRSEEVHAELRDRYEVFCQVLHNFPMPLYEAPEPRPGDNNYEYFFDALQLQHQEHQVWQRQVFGAQTSLLNGPSSSESSSNLSNNCAYYENAVRRTLAQLGEVTRAANDVDMHLGSEKKDVQHLISSSDDE